MEENNPDKSNGGSGAGKFMLGAAIGAVAGAIAGKFARDKYVENKDEIDAKVASAKQKVVEKKDQALDKAGEMGRKAKGKAQRGALRATRDMRKGLDKIDKTIKKA